MPQAVEIRGLKEFRGALRRADSILPRVLRAGLKEAARPVADEARANLPRRSGRLAGTVRPGANARGAFVSMGGARAPYAGFIEFGGNVGRNKSVHREFVAGGRYLFPAFKARQPEVTAAAARVIDVVAKEAGLG